MFFVRGGEEEMSGEEEECAGEEDWREEAGSCDPRAQGGGGHGPAY